MPDSTRSLTQTHSMPDSTRSPTQTQSMPDSTRSSRVDWRYHIVKSSLMHWVCSDTDTQTQSMPDSTRSPSRVDWRYHIVKSSLMHWVCFSTFWVKICLQLTSEDTDPVQVLELGHKGYRAGNSSPNYYYYYYYFHYYYIPKLYRLKAAFQPKKTNPDGGYLLPKRSLSPSSLISLTSRSACS